MSTRTRKQKWAGGVGLVAAGAVAGGILAGTLSANAADETTTGTDSSTSQQSEQATVDPSQPQRADEQLLTGDTKTKVEAAVEAAYPGATIERTETDSEGVYESHVVTADGEHLIVQVGEDFAVTGTDTGGGGRGRDGGGGHGHGGPRDDSDDDSAESGS